MKIIHFIAALPRGGAEVFLLNLAKLSPKNHYVISLLGGNLESSFNKNNIKLLKLNNIHDIVLMFKILIQREIRIQGWMYHGNILAQIFGTLFWHRKNVFLSVHNLTHDLSMKLSTRFISTLSGRLANLLNQTCIFVSKESYSNHYYHGYKGNCVVIPNGIDFNQNKKKYIHDKDKINKNYLSIGCAARLDPHKGHDILFKFFEKFIDLAPNTKLVLCGKGTEIDKIDIDQYNGISKNLISLGEIDNMNIFYEKVDIVIVPSKFEAFGLVALESAARGIPCFVSDVGPLPSIINLNSYIFINGDSNDLLNKVIIEKDNNFKNFYSNYEDLLKRFKDNYSINNIYIKYQRIWRI